MATPVNGLFIAEKKINSAPVHYVLQIDSFSALVTNKIDKYVSNEFQAGGHKWKMIFYPRGDNNTARDHISLHLTLSDDKVGGPIFATVKFSLFDQVNDIHFTKQGEEVLFHKLKLRWGISDFMRVQPFNDPSKGYLHNDSCMFGVSIFVHKSSGIGESLSLKKEASLPYLHKWTLTKYSSLHDEKIRSEVFTVENYKWYLELYPKGDTRCNNDFLSLFLYLDNTNLAEGHKVCARFTLFLKGQDGVVHRKNTSICSWYSSGNNGLGWSTFMSSNEFQMLIRDYYYYIIEAEVTVLGEVTTIT